MVESRNDSKQILGVILAFVLGIIAAVLWAFIVHLTGYRIGLAAVGVGFVVSQGFVWVGKSDLSVWGVVAAVIAALSILIGQILVVIFSLTAYYDISFFKMVPIIDYKELVGYIVEYFEVYDFVFYAVAIHTAYSRSYNKVSLSYSEYLKHKDDLNQQPTTTESINFSDEGEEA